MTNNHCPNPSQFRNIISLEIRDSIDDFAEKITEMIYEFCEEQSFETFRFMPEEWADCQNCERNVLNAQEKALENIEKLLLSVMKTKTPMFD